MADPYIGEIRTFGFNFTPNGWFPCNGQLLPISQYNALFALLGTTYGGDGRVTFGLPQLQGAAMMGWGDGPGLTPRQLGEDLGSNNVTLLTTEIPSHTHALNGHNSNANPPVNMTAAPTVTSQIARPVTFKSGGTAEVTASYSNIDQVNTQMAPQTIGVTGQNVPHENQQPYLTLNYCICAEGIFPPHS